MRFALAVYEFLDELRERIWDLYQKQIIEQFRADCEQEQKNDAQLELTLFPFDDKIPF